MKVSELRELLTTAPDDAEVLIASDPEGNDFHPLFEVDPEAKAVLDKDGDSWYWYVMAAEDQEDGDNLSTVVVLWP